jgi:molybdate transport system substrate-binding protein
MSGLIAVARPYQGIAPKNCTSPFFRVEGFWPNASFPEVRIRSKAFGAIHECRKIVYPVKRLKRSAICIGLFAILALSSPSSSYAADIKLLSAASMQTVLREVVGDFERAFGHRVIILYSTMGAITDRVGAGEEADLVISSPASIASLVARGKINPGSQVIIAKTGVGIVVPSGNAKPSIASVEDFKRVLLAARVIVYANPARGGAAGIHITRLIEKLGLAEQLQSRTKLAAGGDVTEFTLAQGDGALGMTQVSEIVGRKSCKTIRVLQSARRQARGSQMRSPHS